MMNTQWLRRVALGSILLTATVVAQAQARVFPEKTSLGNLELGNFPEAKLNGKDARFAPGGRILNVNNASMLPMTVQGSIQVLYQLDTMGQIQTAWLLTSDEVNAAKQREADRKAAARNSTSQ
jgi:hypothetical protein